jgi:hypothetical protein
MLKTTKDNSIFSFEISLSVLNHLGRNLYRSFATVLGEAISNAWDADAKNVSIYINKTNNSFFIKDDGVGMTSDDFQYKFLKIGYSKRKDGGVSSPKGRPYIGRKGIGKLALLSCAEKITVISKTNSSDYIGGVIDNTGLDKAITEDLAPEKYQLGAWDDAIFKPFTAGHKHGTIIYFEGIKDGIKSSLDFLKKIVALYFRFSLLDKSFNIYIDGTKITHDALDDLAEKTEFLWKINDHEDPYVKSLEKRFAKEKDEHEQEKIVLKGLKTKGFVASVERPRDLKIMTTEERIGIDLFVNGRLRERDILKHIPTSRVAENYLYGQIHFDELNDGDDRFTSSREGVVADDPEYKKFLEAIRKNVILKIVDDWDKWRIAHRKDGDTENERMAPRDRKSMELYNAVSKDYSIPGKSKHKKKVDTWVNDLADDAQYNFSSYAECFISENLIRNYIDEKKIVLSDVAKAEVAKWKKAETESKNKGNISITIRKNGGDLSYLSMDGLAYLVDKHDANKPPAPSLARDANEYKPMRDSLAHTALLTDAAKKKLTSVYENIKGRLITLLSGKA